MNELPKLRSRARLIGQVLLSGLVALGIARFVASGLLPATRSINGDFAAVFPTRYFAQLRPDFPTAAVWSGWRYGPMVHFLTLPLFLVPKWSLVPAAWAMVNLAAIIASFFLVRRLASAGRASFTATAVLAAAWMFYQPLANCFAQGNVELAEMVLILAALVLLPRWKGWVSGILIGVAAMIKVLPIGFLGWFLLRRHHRAFLGGLAAIAVILVITTGTLGWKDADPIWDMTADEGAKRAGVQELSITSLFMHRTSVLLRDAGAIGVQSSPAPAWFPSERSAVASRAGTLTSLLLAAGFALVLFLRRHRPASPNEVGVLFMTMFMILPWNHDYYYVFALVPLSVLLIEAVERRKIALLAGTLAGYLLISPPIPFSWIDRTGWLPLKFGDVFSYYDLPIVGALIVWLIVTQQMFAEPSGDVVPQRSRVSRTTAIGVSTVAIVVAAVGFVAVSRRNPVVRPAADALSPQPSVFLSGPPALALSSDGAYLAYVADRGGDRPLCVHAIARATTVCISGTDGAGGPFFSPDSHWIAFFVGGALKKVAVDGQTVQVIAESQGARVGYWAADDTIFLATASDGITRIPVAGGTIDIVVPQLPTDATYSWPILLPGGEIVLFAVPPPGGGLGAGWITAYSLTTGQRKLLFPGTQPYFDATTGRLNYTLSGRILTVAFDPASLRSSGPSMPVAHDVLVTADGGPQLAYGGQGTVVYVPNGLPVVRREMVWVDRDGSVVSLGIRPDALQTPRVSPDGQSVVAAIRGVTTDLWKYDLANRAQTRLTFAAASNDTPVWTPNGGIAFNAPIGAGIDSAVFVIPAGGTARDASWLWFGPGRVRLGSWSLDGRTVAGTEAGDLWIFDPAGLGAPAAPGGSPRNRWRTIIARTVPVELGAVASPDGRYVAYSSNESGQTEIYMQSVREFSDRRQVSINGGTEPVWSRDGRELFYRNGNAMMAAGVAGGTPRALFEGAYSAGDGVTNYDVAPDGRRFLMLRDIPAASSNASPLAIRSLPVR